MKEVKISNETAAIFHSSDEWKKGLDFLTPNETFIQAGTWWYDSNIGLKAHRHIINPRKILRTQETIVVISGSLKVILYNDENVICHEEILKAGDIGIILTVGHGYTILEDNTKVVEVKNGPFFSVSADKTLIS